MPTLYIIRGLPGSGKSSLASRLVHPSRHCEADMFHFVNGVYQYDKNRASDAHSWCFLEIKNLMGKTRMDCAVSNTFTLRKEYQPYIDAAELYHYDVQIIECHSSWKSIHSVPDEVVREMAKRWEHHN